MLTPVSRRQILPQLLYHLKVDTFQGAHAAETLMGKQEIDWGILTVYTCPRSCAPAAPEKSETSEKSEKSEQSEKASSEDAGASTRWYTKECVWRQHFSDKL